MDIEEEVERQRDEFMSIRDGYREKRAVRAAVGALQDAWEEIMVEGGEGAVALQDGNMVRL